MSRPSTSIVFVPNEIAFLPTAFEVHCAKLHAIRATWRPCQSARHKVSYHNVLRSFDNDAKRFSKLAPLSRLRCCREVIDVADPAFDFFSAAGDPARLLP